MGALTRLTPFPPHSCNFSRVNLIKIIFRFRSKPPDMQQDALNPCPASSGANK